MQHGNQHLRLCCDGPVKMNGASFRPRFQGSLEPFGEQGEVVTDFELDFFWQGRHLGAHECPDAKRDAAPLDTVLPVFEVIPNAHQRVLNLVLQCFHAVGNSFPVAPQNSNHQTSFRREVMMNAGLTDLHRLRNIGVTESGITTVDEEGVGRVENFFSRFTLHATKTTN